MANIAAGIEVVAFVDIITRVAASFMVANHTTVEGLIAATFVDNLVEMVDILRIVAGEEASFELTTLFFVYLLFEFLFK